MGPIAPVAPVLPRGIPNEKLYTIFSFVPDAETEAVADEPAANVVADAVGEPKSGTSDTRATSSPFTEIDSASTFAGNVTFLSESHV